MEKSKDNKGFDREMISAAGQNAANIVCHQSFDPFSSNNFIHLHSWMTV
ncbi:hypothetical protein KIS4809_0789 [Bacillus sp. ZZV12-4809]|nr:hypothetical protein KIS4809_0789 [Bacillus sp. ZZV12-4809]